MLYIRLGKKGEPQVYGVSGISYATDFPRNEHMGKPTEKRVIVGTPPFFRVTGIGFDGSLITRELDPEDPADQHAYRKVVKWVGAYNLGRKDKQHKPDRCIKCIHAARRGEVLQHEPYLSTASRLMLNNNPGLTEEQIKELFENTL